MSQPSEKVYIGPGGLSYSDGTLTKVYSAIVADLQDRLPVSGPLPVSGNEVEIEMITAEASYQKNL